MATSGECSDIQKTKIKLNRAGDYYVSPVLNYTYKDINTVVKGAQTKNPVKYYQTPLILDTETSHNHNEEYPIGWIYQWCMEWHGEYAIGRSVEELIKLLRWVYDTYNLDDNNRVVIYVHNLSYDYTYLSGWLYEEFGKGEILALKSRKILTVRHGGLEFRCSYLLSNMSLAQWGKKLKCNIRKMIGAIDYDAINFSDTALQVTDWEYMINDVASLKECVYRAMYYDKDTLASIPLTSTGYVRRDVRRATRKDKKYRKWFMKCKLSVRAYQLLRYAFAGGLTHGNRFFGGKIVEDVDHIDYKSHYPSRQQLDYMPMGPFLCYFDKRVDGSLDPEVFQELLNTQCCLIHILFKNLRLKKGVTLPVLSKSKVRSYMLCRFTNDWDVPGTDNGKVINAYGTVAVVCTELDLKWILDQYDTDGYEVQELYVSERGRVPECVRDVINKYFIDKESLPDGIFRDKSKNKLNGIYGMFATDCIRPEVSYNYLTMEWSELKDLTPELIQEKLDKYYSNRNNFTFYAHGVWTTAWARDCLLDITKNIIGYKAYLYSDTDSVFFKASPEITKKILEYNDIIIQKNKDYGLGVTNKDGDISYYGILAFEEHCKTFKFLHSKCYGYTDDDDKLHITVAGVTKDNRLPEDDPRYMTREEELGSLDKLADGFIFKECGGTRSVYVDYPPTETNIDGHRVLYANACIILNTTKELGGTVDGFEIMEVI